MLIAQCSFLSIQVIDDESDYFSVDSNKWLSSEQRAKLRMREEEIREGFGCEE